MSTSAFIPIAASPAIATVFFLCLGAVTIMLLSALSDYLGWITVKDHACTDPELEQCLAGVQPPPYLLRLCSWLALWFALAAGFKVLVL